MTDSKPNNTKFIKVEPDELISWSHYIKVGPQFEPFDGITGFKANAYNVTLYRRKGRKVVQNQRCPNLN